MTKKTTTQSSATKTNKNEEVISLMKREGGASLEEITNATGWLPHSARAVLTGFRKKGFTIDKSKADGVTRWSVTAEPAA